MNRKNAEFGKIGEFRLNLGFDFRPVEKMYEFWNFLGFAFLSL